jgi:hypothetical protein
MHVLVLCIAIFRSHGELTVLNGLALKGICLCCLFFIRSCHNPDYHNTREITIIQ